MSAELQIEDRTRLLIVTVNYRTGSLVVDSLRSLKDEIQSVPGTKVAVIDNNSGDDSVEKLAPRSRQKAGKIGQRSYPQNLMVATPTAITTPFVPPLQQTIHPTIFCCLIPIHKCALVPSKP